MKRVIRASTDGWDVPSSLKYTLEQIGRIAYEIDNCVKGAYSNCDTYKELSERLVYLGEQLVKQGGDLEDMSDEDDWD